MPKLLPKLDQIKRVVVGDLHGNFHKLVDHFIRIGALTMDKKDYVQLINDPTCIDILIAEGKLKVNPNAPELTLLGDIFADRNKFDRAKLSLLSYLSENGVKYKIIHSNHDENFMYDLMGKEGAMKGKHAHKTFIETSTREKFNQIFRNHYQFAQVTDGCLFSHAPIHNNDFNQLFTKIEQQINQKTSENATSVDPAILAKLRISKDPTTPPYLQIALKIEIINYIYKMFDFIKSDENIKPDKNEIPHFKTFRQFVWQRMEKWEPNDISIAQQYKLNAHFNGHDEHDQNDYNHTLDNKAGKSANYGNIISKNEQILIFYHASK
jgi:hypothetical protein